MRVIIRVIFCVLLLANWLPGTIVHAEKPVVYAEADAVRVHVGDVFEFRIIAERTPETTIRFPDDSVDLSPFVILDRQIALEELQDGRIRESLILSLSIYQTGDFEISSVNVTWKNKDDETGMINTEPQFLQVQTLLNPDEEIKPRALKGPLGVEPRGFYVFRTVAIFIGSILVLLGIVYLIRKLTKKQPHSTENTVSEPWRPAHEIALEKLEELKSKRYLSQGMIRNYFIDLSEILKEYLARRFAVLALEHTTGEIRKDLKTLQVEQRLKSEVMSILELSDMVKFAKHLPSDDICRDVMDRVEKFIAQTQDNSLDNADHEKHVISEVES